MRLDTQPLLLVAARLSLSGHLDGKVLAELRTTLITLEGRLAAKEEHVEAYEASRAQLALDGTPLAWARWRAENLLLTCARAEVERLQSSIRFNMESLECEVARAQQKRARTLANVKEVLA
ncbi:hypothetical protein [Hyalangium sp.]|uniref:hypothetical protein n=1 Tax=Hyalangium sp. TaxID=2028555 RepID=UPI002D73FBFC|nr:hypothetical protein [Hyalangium sp.]HYH96900.1 hypothetical protein [Hyalangium sp.]